MFDRMAFAEECNVADAERFCARVEQLYALLTEANAKVNLTRITEAEDFWVKHVADSLLLAKAFPELTRRRISLCDIGCGGGFPSLVLSLAFPEWKILAMDSIGKKTAFVRAAAQTLDLTNCEVVTGRSCELNRRAEYRGRFDIVTARAVARGETIVRDARNFPKRHGGFILYKTPAQAAEDLPILTAENRNWRVSSEYELPDGAGTRCFLTDLEC